MFRGFIMSASMDRLNPYTLYLVGLRICQVCTAWLSKLNYIILSNNLKNSELYRRFKEKTRRVKAIRKMYVCQAPQVGLRHSVSKDNKRLGNSEFESKFCMSLSCLFTYRR